MILYAFYFGWAFFILLFQLVEWIEDRLHTQLLVPAICLAGVVGLAMVNIPAIAAMMKFAIARYPV